MYTNEQLKKEFLSKIKAENPNIKAENLIDNLTKVISRKYIMEYADFLIEYNVPFCFQMIDIDNFKRVNDNYGHQKGDDVLKAFAARLGKKVGVDGMIGRYGGDEFIVILPNISSYDEAHDYISSHFFGDGAPMRSRYIIDELQTFITGTIGSASFPNDAKDLDELFLKADKALYRGKTKGRNCYIVYVDSKHRDIDVNKGHKRYLQDIFNDVIVAMENSSDEKQMFDKLNNYLVDALKISTVEFYDKNKFKDIADLFDNKNLYKSNDMLEIKMFKETYLYAVENDILSMLISKIVFNGEVEGYIVFTEKKIHRIWQDEDCALILFISKLYAYMSKFEEE